jgi:protein-L-isoaspartate(D-aspartate) O-methyltransferase
MSTNRQLAVGSAACTLRGTGVESVDWVRFADDAVAELESGGSPNQSHRGWWSLAILLLRGQFRGWHTELREVAMDALLPFKRLLLAAAVVLVLARVAFAQGTSRDTFRQARLQMVDVDLATEGIENPRVLDAMRTVPRHLFVRPGLRNLAYFDQALDIGFKQTISPPFIVAYMTQVLDPQPEDRVLEIGTGSGYQAAVLAGLVKEVYTIEIVEDLGKKAERQLKQLKYDNVHVRVGDGYLGWPEHAPFDKIIVTCSPESVPKPLVEQLKDGGRMIIPLGERYQQVFHLLEKQNG